MKRPFFKAAPAMTTDYSGMTVNERLVVAGQIELWDSAVLAGDKAGMIEILLRTDLTRSQAEETATATLANPAKYGFPPRS